MANIRKQFNFRNGVQVDDDKLIVSPSGLVGIGTSVPTESLDVRGNLKVVGFATFDQASTPDLTAVNSNLTDINLLGSIVGSGIRSRNGIVTSSSAAGVVTFYGDGVNLLNIPTSQWVDVDVGLGFTSIYAAGYVGIGTVDPRFLLQIAGTPDTSVVGFTSGVGITSEGNVLITGITTSGKFVGIGSDIVDLTASNIAYGTLNSDRLPVIDGSLLSNFLQLGIVTTTTLNTTDLTAGIATATDLTVLGTLTGTASTALGLTGSPDIVVGILTANSVAASSFVGGITGDVTGTASTARSLTQNAVVNIDQLTVGLATVSNTLLVDGSVGIGTSTPTADLEIRSTLNSDLRLISDNASSIGFGKSDNILGYNGSIRFGNTSALFPYSLHNAIDILNYGDGNFNYYLEAGNSVGLNTGNFYWHKGTSNRLMTLTYDGKLGIGITEPINEHHVVGTSTVTNDLFVGDQLFVFSDSTFHQDLTVGGTLNAGTLSIGAISGNLTGNVNAISGISTFNDITSGGFIGIGTDTSPIIAPIPEKFAVNLPGPAHVFVDQSGNIGIKTFNIYNPGITAPTTDVTIASVSIGRTTGRCAIDFSNAANTDILGAGRDAVAYMIPPRLTTTQRNNLTNVYNTGVEEGAMIYNIDTSKLQVFDGSNWQDCF